MHLHLRILTPIIARLSGVTPDPSRTSLSNRDVTLDAMTSAARIDPIPDKKKRTTARTGRRKFSWQYSAYVIHSFVGLKLTLLLTVVLATGAIAVIAQEIDWLIYSEMRSPAQAERMNPGELLDRLEAAYPDKGLSFFTPNVEHPNTSARAMMTQSDGGFRYAWINPYTGEVTGDTPLLTLGEFLGFLHGTLFLPVIGRAVVNAFGVLTLISLVTGLIAYPGFWRYFFRAPRTGNLRVLLADLHKLVGLWSLWFVLIIGITGSWWFYKYPLVKVFGAPNPVPAYETKPLLSYEQLDVLGNETPTRLSNAEVVDIVQAAYPGLEIRSLAPPAHNAEPYAVSGRFDEWLTNNISNTVYVNAYNGQITGTELIESYHPAQRVDMSMGPLHYGTWGNSGTSDLIVKLVWFVFGALMTGLAVTGLIINIKRCRRATRITLARSGVRRYLKKTWLVARPWGGPMSGFKYFNVLALMGILAGSSIAISIGNDGTKGSGYQYLEKPLGEWSVKVNAVAGLLERDLPPIREGYRATFYVDIPEEARKTFKFVHVRIGKPRTLRAPGTLVAGPRGLQAAEIVLPGRIRDNAQLWVTAQAWDGTVYQTQWPLKPDGKETIDAR